MGSELTIDNRQNGFTQQQVAALQQLGVHNASQGDLAVFFHQVQRTGLDPFARQIYMIERKGKQTIQTGIDGFRLIARRAADARHETFGEPETLWCGTDGKWRDVWLEQTAPAAAKVTVQRGAGSFTGVATYREYAGMHYDKKTGQQTVNDIWKTKPAIMLSKCAEALALRKAFPQDLSGLYTADEMQASEPEHGYVDATVVATQAQRDELTNLLREAGVGSAADARKVFRTLTPSHTDTADPSKIPDDDVLLLLDNKQTLQSKIAYILELDKRQTATEEAPDGR